MATHEIPVDGFRHVHVADCLCQPTTRRQRRADGFMATVYVHQDQGPEDEDQDTDCGHTLVQVGDEIQHHEIPGDDAPHAPTSECGCGPQRETVGGHVVYVHVNQDPDDDDWDGEQ